MQPATHVLDTGAEARERIRLEIDVTELDHASPGCTDKSAVLPLDASVTDGALRVVPGVNLELISDLALLEAQNDSKDLRL